MPMTDKVQRMPRYRLSTPVDVTVLNGSDTYWGSLINLSRTGVSIIYWQYPKGDESVRLRFRLQSTDRREVREDLNARAVWKSGENVGLRFEQSLMSDSPVLQKAPCLVGRLVEKEAGL